MMAHNTLENYYKTVFSLVYHHKMSIDVESLFVYERDIYTSMIKDHLEKVKEQQIQDAAKAMAQQRLGKRF